MKAFLLLVLITAGCASPNKMKDLDTQIEPKGKISSNETVALNSSGEAVIQQKQKASEELRGLIWWNNNLEQEVSSERYDLKRCRKESADPRLNGSGEVAQLPEIDGLKSEIQNREQIGLDGKDLVVVKEEYLRDRIKQERDYNTSLEKLLKLVKNYKDKCEDKLSMQRVKADLPVQRFQGQFQISPDGKIEGIVSPHEKNLDDAFEIRDQNRRQPTSQEYQN